MVPLVPRKFLRETITVSLSFLLWKSDAMRAVTNPHNRTGETTQFTFFFTTVASGRSVPVNPTVNAKATMAKVYELASASPLKEQEKEGPEPPSIFSTMTTQKRNYCFTVVAPQLSQYTTASIFKSCSCPLMPSQARMSFFSPCRTGTRFPARRTFSVRNRVF
jgi:hypothetical protein